MNRYRAIDIANYIINKGVETGYNVSNLTLQKILYYVQAAFLIEYGEPIFNEPIFAWKYGPVVESVYHQLKIHANDKILDRVEFEDDIVIEGDGFYFIEKEYNPENIIDKDSRVIIDRVFDSKKSKEAFSLVNDTHEEDPWKNCWKEGYSNIIISIQEIEQYFKENVGRIYGA